jgi:hypothetical protein
LIILRDAFARVGILRGHATRCGNVQGNNSNRSAGATMRTENNMLARA